MGPFTSFAVHPEGIKFETQESDEEVVLFLRQHLVMLAPTALLGIVMLLAPPVLLPFFFRFLELPFVVPGTYVVVGTVLWYVMTFGVVLAQFLHWFFNIYVVTNERLVDIDFVNLLYKEFSEARLEKIQDVSFTSRGLLAATFNFGNVKVQTAGEQPNFTFDAVPDPDEVVRTISELAQKVKGTI